MRLRKRMAYHLATESGGVRVPVIRRLLAEHVVIRSHGLVGFVPHMEDKLWLNPFKRVVIQRGLPRITLLS